MPRLPPLESSVCVEESRLLEEARLRLEDLRQTIVPLKLDTLLLLNERECLPSLLVVAPADSGRTNVCGTLSFGKE